MKLRSSLEVTEEHIQAAVKIVSELPRGLDSSGKPYRGVFHDAARTAFYREFKDLIVNPNCTFDKPCGSCKRDVFQQSTRIAEERRLIVSKGWRPKLETGSDGRLVLSKRGYRKYYRPDEVPKQNVDKWLDELEKLGLNGEKSPTLRERLNHGERNLSGENLAGMDLTGVDLGGINLSKANLNGAILSNGILNHANLLSANLRAANLYGAILSNSNLEEANLSEANLCKANLRHANLRNADLNKANLFGADLTEANLTGADMNQAIIDNAIFYKTKRG